MEYKIYPAKTEEWEDAMALSWRVFNIYEAPEYSQEGVDSFLNFISDQNLYKMFSRGFYKLYLAKDSDGKLLGVIGVRNKNHISLLFVESKAHKQGIGSALMDYALKEIRGHYHLEYATVNSSSYAEGFYHKLGFVDMGPKQESQGLIYTPMQIIF